MSHSSKVFYPIDSIKLEHHNIGEYKSNWMLEYDYRTKNPKWVYEHLYSDDIFQNADRKKSHFFSETSILNENFRISSKDYNDSGYDRGHMIPANDFKLTQNAINSTFTMANISPQNSNLNKGLWSQLESWLKSLLKSRYHELIIISGPVFAPIFIKGKWIYYHKTCGYFPKLITVPTHFFKVVLAKKIVKIDSDTSIEYISCSAFLLPNQDNETKSNITSFENFIVKLVDLESILGFTLLDNFLTQKDKADLDSYVPDSRNLTFVLSSDAVTNKLLLKKTEKNISDGRSIPVDFIRTNSRLNHLCINKGCDFKF
jgi:DNA/RNA endonuclease G (NUC1)